jgi:hypothetical protein
MIDAGWCRPQVNGRVGRVRRVWKWGVENELVPAATYQALAAVAGLQRGRSEAGDRELADPDISARRTRTSAERALEC